MSDQKIEQIHQMVGDLLRIVGKTNAIVEETRQEVKEIRQELNETRQEVKGTQQELKELNQKVDLLASQTNQGFKEVHERLDKSLRVTEYISSKMVEHEAEIRHLNKIAKA